MTVTNNRLPTNALFQLNQTSDVYLGSGSTNLPGLTNVLFTPYNFYHDWNGLAQAYEIGDKEGILENYLKVLEAPTSLSNALLKLSCYITYIKFFVKQCSGPNAGPFIAPVLATSSVVSKLIVVTGLILCAFEAVFESVGLWRDRNFLKSIYQSEEEELKSKKSHIPYLKTLHWTHFQIPSIEMREIDAYVKNKLSDLSEGKQAERKDAIIKTRLAVKKNELVRRVHPWLAKRIEETLPQIFKDTTSPLTSIKNTAKDKAESLFANIRIQAEKNQLVHATGIAAVLITVAGLIAECFLCVPLVAPTTLALAGGALATGRGLLFSGLMDTEGWDFSVKKCFPETIQKHLN